MKETKYSLKGTIKTLKNELRICQEDKDKFRKKNATYANTFVPCTTCGSYKRLFDSIICNTCHKVYCSEECADNHICAAEKKSSGGQKNESNNNSV